MKDVTVRLVFVVNDHGNGEKVGTIKVKLLLSESNKVIIISGDGVGKNDLAKAYSTEHWKELAGY